MNLWNDTFRIELFFSNPYENENRKTLIHKGSLKSAIRWLLREYKDVHVVADFYTSKGKWLKEIGM